MINMYEVSETNEMIEHENLDVRTITLGISLLDCIDSDLEELNRKIYDKITETAKDLVSVGRDIEKEFGIPIVNKLNFRYSIALVGGAACKSPEDFVTIAKTLDRAADKVGVNFIGGYSALVSKGMTKVMRIDSFDPSGAGADRKDLQFRKRRFYKDRDQYGCGTPVRRDCKSNSRRDERKRFSRVCKTCYFL